jgi:hypothetical protein
LSFCRIKSPPVRSRMSVMPCRRISERFGRFRRRSLRAFTARMVSDRAPN